VLEHQEAHGGGDRRWVDFLYARVKRNCVLRV